MSTDTLVNPSPKKRTKSIFFNEEYKPQLPVCRRALQDCEWSVLAAICIALSLQQNAKEISLREKRPSGQEVNRYSIEDENLRPLSVACAYIYDLKPSDEVVPLLLEAHMNAGFEILQSIVSSHIASVALINGDGELQNAASRRIISERVLSALNQFAPLTEHKGAPITGLLSSLLVYVGQTVATSESQWLEINAEGGMMNNAHLAVAGKAGTGKTQLLLALLMQALRSDSECGCVVFDYKGDITEEHSQSFKELGFEIRRLGIAGNQLPINPLYLPQDAEPALAAREFAELCKLYRKGMGPVQVGLLRDIVMELFIGVRETPGSWVDLSHLERAVKEVKEAERQKRNLLYEMVSDLNGSRIFCAGLGSAPTEFLGQRLLIDISRLIESLRDLSAFFILRHLITGAREIGEADLKPREDGVRIRKLRTILALDEAHNYLQAGPQDLQKLVREGRSKGVAVWLSSQSINDYKADTDVFSNNMGTWFLFSHGVAPTPKVLAGLLSVGSAESEKAAAKLTQLQQGRCLLGLKEKATEIIAAQWYQHEQWPSV